MATPSRVLVTFVLVTFVPFQGAKASCPDGCDCEPAILPHEVTCTGEKIVNIPTNLPFVTTSLTITNTGITKVRATDLQPLKRLRHLSLPNNKISAIESGAFDDLHRLEYFDISGNVLNAFPSGLFQNSPILQELNGASNNISLLPEDILSGLSHLDTIDLSNNRITKISKPLFSNTKGLNQIVLNDNMISTIDDGAFAKIETLFFPLEIYLHNNQLTSITNDTFKISGIQGIQTLTLHDNKIAAIESGSFMSAKQLDELDLSNNQLSAVPAGLLSEHVSLNTVNFEFNKLKSFPKGIFGPRTAVENVILANNQLTDIEEGSLVVKGLNYIDLSYNLLSRFSFSGLKSVDTISLNNNKLTGLPTGLNDAKSLTTLDLYDNEMDAIPADAFQDLERLNRLNLANSLKANGTLNTQAFCHLPRLQSLVLDGDYLLSVPTSALNCLTTLTSLTLSGNQIKNVTTDFGKSSNLLELFLKDNDISMVPTNMLMPYVNLVRIDMTSNSITHLSSNSFPNTKLANLMLESNRISFLENSAFQGLSSLETVNLANNLASYLPGNIFAGFKNLSKVTLDNNPWACDCLMKDFAQWLNTSSPTLDIEVECRTPSKHFGKNLRDLSLDELTCDDCKPQTSAPKIDQSGGQVQGSVGKDAILMCNVTACPQAEIFWTIPQSPGVELSKYSYQYSRFHVDNKNGTLTVKSTLASDAGEYHCKAFNGLGSDSKVVKLTVM
ncbi:uncharacterized protein LOC144865845 [Branchiostoma floridae x Branchiostoma japonicum]